MMTDDDILRDLMKLKEIAAALMGAEMAVETVAIDGRETAVFAKAPRNLGELFEMGLTEGEHCFLVYGDERYSFAETDELARRLARVLREGYGIGKGDRVALCGRNSPQWCIGYMAVTLIGAVAVPMNSWWKGPELEYGLRDSGSRLVLADAPRLRLLEPYLGPLQMQAVLMRGDDAEEEDGPSQPSEGDQPHPSGEPAEGSAPRQGDPALTGDYPALHSLLADTAPLSAQDIAGLGVKPEDNATIMYTSGSTGNPKGVLSTHRNIINALWTWKFAKEAGETLHPELVEENPPWQPAILCNVPLFHVTGSHAQFLACFIYHRKMVMMYKWDAEQALRLIEKERISILHGVPTMTWEVLHAPGFKQADLSSLRNVQAGGAPRPPEHLRLITRGFPAIAQPGLGYGLTETNAIGAIITGEMYLARPHSTGRPTPPVTEVRIVNEAGDTLPPEQTGEICIRGATVMRGYWNQPEATAEAIKDGWFHTGDIGKLDALGFLVILDRAKDIVIRGGENIACAEVEYAIAEHPAVNEASAYGIPDTRLGEVLCASLMLKPNAILDAPTLKAFLAQRIADFKIPQHLFFHQQQLPRVASGKIARKALRQQAIDRLNTPA